MSQMNYGEHSPGILDRNIPDSNRRSVESCPPIFRDASSATTISTPAPIKQSPDFHGADVMGVDLHAREDGEYLVRRHLVEFIDQPELAERPIDKDARIAYIGTDVSNLNYLVKQQFRSQNLSVCHFPSNRMSRQHTCYEPDRLPVEAFQLPSKDVVDRLLDGYFRHVNPGFPVIDETLFMAQYRARDPQNPPSLLLLHAILVVGAHVSQDPKERTSYKAVFFRRAKTLFDARFERNRDTIVQAALLLTWYADGLEDVAANAWFWLGVAARTATGLGMHRDADKSTLVPHNKRMWRRVWWLLFQCDVLVSMQYGRPQSIHLEDSDVQRLRSSDFQDCGAHTQVDYIIQATELCKIISEALRGRFRLSTTPEARSTALRKIDDALANWSLRLPNRLHLQTALSMDLWSANLHLQYNVALILLHRSQPYQQTRAEDHRTSDADVCVTAASAIQSIFQGLCERDELRFLWISSINFLFTALIQLSVEVRFANPVLAISALRRYDSALVSLREVTKFWPHAQSILHFFETSVRLGQPDTANEPRGAGRAPPSPPPTSAARSTQISTSTSSSTRLDVIEIDDSDPASGMVDSTERRLKIGEHRSSRSILTEQHSEQHQEASGTVASTSPSRNAHEENEEVQETWQQWRESCWQQPEFIDDFLFTF
jgi:transcriptional regulatory protein AMDR